MEWMKITGPVPTDIRYEALPEPGIRAKIDSITDDNWPAFRWSVDIYINGQRLHCSDLAVDLPSAKRCAENYLSERLPRLDLE